MKAYRMRDNATPMVVRRAEIERVISDDESPDTSHLEQDYADVPDEEERAKYLAQDEARLRALWNDEWHFVGIQAQAHFYIDIGGAFVRQTVESPGLWGIESDSGDAYFDEVFAEESATLESMIEKLGVAVVD